MVFLTMPDILRFLRYIAVDIIRPERPLQFDRGPIRGLQNGFLPLHRCFAPLKDNKHRPALHQPNI